MSEIKGATNFEKLFSRKLNKILKKKGNFDYLSCPTEPSCTFHSIREIRKRKKPLVNGDSLGNT